MLAGTALEPVVVSVKGKCMKGYQLILVLLMMQLTVAAQTQLASLRATERINAIEISWVALNEANMQSHVIERSTNGTAFNSIGSVTAQNNNTSYQYHFTDATPVQGGNYYRLRSVTRSGNVSYSNILTVNQGITRADVVVLGNPVRGGVVNLQLQNLDKGRYAINLYNSVGQQVYTRSMDYSGGSATEIINLPNNVGKGIHTLQVTNGADRFSKQLLLQ